MAKWQATIEAPLTEYGRHGAGRPVGAEPGDPAAAQTLKGFNLDGAVRPAPTSSIPWSRRASSPSPTARRSTATRSSSTRRCNPAVGRLQRRPPQADRSGARRSTNGQRPTAAWRRGGSCASIRAPRWRRAARARRGRPHSVMSGDTVHFDIADKDGNMVSATPSGGWLHGSPVVPELGFRSARAARSAGSRKVSSLAGAGQAAAPRSRPPRPSRRRAVHVLGLTGW